MAYVQVSSHPKFLDLRSILGRPKYAVLGCLEALWNFTAEYTPRGDIGRFSDRQLETAIEWDGEPGELIRALVEVRFLDVDPEHRLVIHDWADYAPDYVKKRIKRQGLDFVIAKPHILSATVQTTADNGGQRRTTADNGGKCLPMSAYRTEPNQTEPNRTPPLPPIGEPTPVEIATDAIAEAHPKGVSKTLLAQAITEQIRGPNEPATLATLRKNTLAWCQVWRDDPKHAPELLRWMRSGGWLKPPPVAVSPPGSDITDELIEQIFAEVRS